ncbi:hypothetical protein OF83DRAFT_1110519 [Amylostereum chailletii]|nr:hypothetical protein OF83DRAFT_1110519 [Amylostereum chailletii]
MAPYPDKRYEFPLPSAEFKNTQRNLYYATHILRDRPQPTWEVAVADDSGRRKDVLPLDHHLATQLIVPSNDGGSTLESFSVSTHLTAAFANVTIVVSRSHGIATDGSEEPELEGSVIPQVEIITEKGRGADVLMQWDRTQEPTFLEQIQDTVDILSYLSSFDSSMEKERDRMLANWLKLLHFRAFAQIGGRGAVLWKRHPIEAIRRWCEVGDPSTLAFLPLKVHISRSSTLRNYTSTMDMIARDLVTSGSFVVNKDNVCVWIKLFVDLFQEIRSAAVQEGDDEKPHIVKNFPKERAVPLARTMHGFSALLKTTLISSFLTDASFLEFFDNFQRCGTYPMWMKT